MGVDLTSHCLTFSPPDICTAVERSISVSADFTTNHRQGFPTRRLQLSKEGGADSFSSTIKKRHLFKDQMSRVRDQYWSLSLGRDTNEKDKVCKAFSLFPTIPIRIKNMIIQLCI